MFLVNHRHSTVTARSVAARDDTALGLEVRCSGGVCGAWTACWLVPGPLPVCTVAGSAGERVTGSSCRSGSADSTRSTGVGCNSATYTTATM